MRNKAVLVAALLAALTSACVSPGLLAKDAQSAGNAVQVSGSESVLSMRVDGELLITQNGRVGEYKVTTDGLPEEVTSLIDQSIATWRFEPVMDAKGAPVVARTYMRMTLVARELEGKRYAMGLENVRFHDGTKRNESAEVRERAHARAARPLRHIGPICRRRRRWPPRGPRRCGWTSGRAPGPS